MGARGPVPKRESQRRRRNKPEGGPVQKAAGASEVPVPKGDGKWHPIAKRWFKSLATSGQAQFYEPSDWALAEVLAESISRDLRPQVVGVNEKTGQVIEAEVPIKGASLSAYLKAMSSLLVTEGDRRRARLELERPAPDDGEEVADVSELGRYRDRLKSG